MGSTFTDPPAYPNVAEFRLVDMYTRVLASENKEEVLASFSQKDGKLHLVIATNALGWELTAQTFTG